MAKEPTQLWTDRTHLTAEAYQNSANLDARKAIYAYQHADDPTPLQEWVLGHGAWRGGETVLDVGCGTGQYLRFLAQQPGRQLLGFDLARGMLADLRRDWDAGARLPALAVADAQALPLPDGCCDAVLAMHMLFHVPNIVQAAHEFRRVLRPGGVLLAVTNGEAHLRELHEVYNTAVERVSGQAMPYESAFQRFTLENGEQLLRNAFAQVERHERCGELRVPEVALILRYIESTRSTREHALPPGTQSNDVMSACEQIIADTIAHNGMFRVQTLSGVFVCR